LAAILRRSRGLLHSRQWIRRVKAKVVGVGQPRRARTRKPGRWPKAKRGGHGRE